MEAASSNEEWADPSPESAPVPPSPGATLRELQIFGTVNIDRELAEPERVRLNMEIDDPKDA